MCHFNTYKKSSYFASRYCIGYKFFIILSFYIADNYNIIKLANKLEFRNFSVFALPLYILKELHLFYIAFISNHPRVIKSCIIEAK